VRKVASNSGRNTPGVDGIIWNQPEQKFSAINDLKDLSKYKATPVKRRYIPKADGKRRPLGIPTIMDRAVQTLYMFTIDPIAEETSCLRSYEYRLHRGVHGNAIYLNLVLGNYTATRRYILEADIKGFFPSVSHKWLLENIPMDKTILKEFLKAGFMEDAFFHEISEGFPQGSPISPPLANMTLNGLEDVLTRNGFLYTRYADDFVVLGKTKEELNSIAKPLIQSFLSERGLVFHPEKLEYVVSKKGLTF
jgi:RNA-directed DNA polymerase